MSATDLGTVFAALAPYPVLQWVFGAIIISICIVTFTRQKAGSAVPGTSVSPTPTLPGIGDPQMYFQGPQAFLTLHTQIRDLHLVQIDSLKRIADILHEMEQRQETMRIEAREDSQAARRR